MRGCVLWLVGVGCGSEIAVSRVPSDPDVQIDVPEPDSVWRQGTPLLEAAGTVNDAFTRHRRLDVVWSLDDTEESVRSDGEGAVAWAIPESLLTVGEHTITLTATDGDGDVGESEVRFYVAGPGGAPVVTIVAPDDGAHVPEGEEIAFRGTAVDASTASDQLLHRWSTDLVGALSGVLTDADGGSVVFATLPVGAHTVTLEVEDDEGEVGRDAIVVYVDAPSPGDTGTVDTGHPDTGHTGDTGPTTTPPVEPGELVFSEFMIDPLVVEDERGEWLELFNTAGGSIDLSGYTLTDDDFDRYVFDALIIPGRGYAVLCADVDPAVNGGISCDGTFVREAAGAVALGNGTDEVILSRPDGVEIDRIVYDDTWFSRGVALGLDPRWLDEAPNDDPSRWCDQTTLLTLEPGTPGITNDACP